MSLPFVSEFNAWLASWINFFPPFTWVISVFIFFYFWAIYFSIPIAILAIFYDIIDRLLPPRR